MGAPPPFALLRVGKGPEGGHWCEHRSRLFLSPGLRVDCGRDRREEQGSVTSPLVHTEGSPTPSPGQPPRPGSGFVAGSLDSWACPPPWFGSQGLDELHGSRFLTLGTCGPRSFL